MAKPYKLNEDIREFIIAQKNKNPDLSCRKLIPIIREHFQVSLSKSLINNVIKENNLSCPVGRRGLKKRLVSKQPIEIKIIRKERGFIEHGGCFFLKIADLILSLTPNLADNLAVYFPNLSKQSLPKMIEALIYTPLFNNQKSLWLFIGKEIPSEGIEQYSQQLAEVPIAELNQAMEKAGISRNINKYNELHKECLLQLNSYVQTNFFPSAYQFLDLPEMQERFYHLWANIKRGEGILEIQFLCSEGFAWKNDIVWQEDLIYAVDRVNASRVFTQEKELLWISSKLEILPANLI